MNEDFFKKIRTSKPTSLLGMGDSKHSETELFLKSISYWNDDESSSDSPEIDFILESFIWLPTSRDEMNPFNSENQKNIQDKGFGLVAAKEISLKLRGVLPSVKLISGIHDFNEAFRGGILYAARFSAKEYINNIQGPWVRIFSKYLDGHWPLGFSGNRLIIF